MKRFLSRLKRVHIKFQVSQRKLALREKIWRFSEDYDTYLRTQLERTLKKKHTPLQSRTIRLVDAIDKLVRLEGKKVLCIGARNVAEINYFKSKHVQSVVGIDLFSDSTEILVMDMHQMTFLKNEFDVVYSCHSLEHAYDPKQVIGEIIRVVKPAGFVGIEVPIQYQTRGSDLIDFGSGEYVIELFMPNVGNILLNDDQSQPDEFGDFTQPVARVIFQIQK